MEKTYEVIIWGGGEFYNHSINLLKFEIMKGNMKVRAIISKDKFASCIDGFRVIDKEQLAEYSFDYIIAFCSASSFLQILKEAAELGVPRQKLLNGRVFEIPCFDLKRYCNLIENPLTIISDDCWGGGISHCLNLKFCSPFVTLFLSKPDYIMLLENFDYYMDYDLKMESEGDIYCCKIPVGYLGEGDKKISVRFNHSCRFQDAKADWDRRKKRINRNNLFVKMTLEDNNVELLERFEALPYKHKICFCPKQMPYASTAFLPRYIWRCKNRCSEAGSNTYGEFVRNYENILQSLDLLKLLNGEENFMRDRILEH